jgi:hypothetical protein
MVASRKLIVAPAVVEDAIELAENLRPDDVREVAATSASDPLAAILRCITASERAWTGRVDGKLAFIGGIGAANMLSGWRVPWLLGTPVLEQNGVAFLRFCRRNLPEIRAAYPLMMNHVDARSVGTVEWLKWLGFRIYPPRPYGILARPFHKFEMRADNV